MKTTLATALLLAATQAITLNSRAYENTLEAVDGADLEGADNQFDANDIDGLDSDDQ